ncbi:hypothetical protein HNQ60_000018 [Povalibacter uvarum]|uniref:Uncharacterized protein n=1 Tax=Povalibacter uvarum TaxID=732238 RepID=A0A841HG08_9GAMM|nr:hypothetical protein [Povalibacter uvarum]MBB6091172.1 hypothetical protein [Povalibacter uvarum]
MSAPEAALRRAALLLHSLDARTREQVIARLSPDETELIVPLLQELATLCVSPTLGAQLSSEAENADLRSAQQDVEAMDPEIVARCLERCSTSTAAHLMNAASWPWKERVLDFMPSQRRIALQSRLRGRLMPLAPAVMKALCARIVAESRTLPACARRSDPWVQWIATLRRRTQRILAWAR